MCDKTIAYGRAITCNVNLTSTNGCYKWFGIIKAPSYFVCTLWFTHFVYILFILTMMFHDRYIVTAISVGRWNNKCVKSNQTTKTTVMQRIECWSIQLNNTISELLVSRALWNQLQWKFWYDGSGCTNKSAAWGSCSVLFLDTIQSHVFETSWIPVEATHLSTRQYERSRFAFPHEPRSETILRRVQK